jgi:hypothetical protein
MGSLWECRRVRVTILGTCRGFVQKKKKGISSSLIFTEIGVISKNVFTCIKSSGSFLHISRNAEPLFQSKFVCQCEHWVAETSN